MMRDLPRMLKGPACLLAAAAAGCTNPAPTNSAAENNAAAEVPENLIVDPELADPGNQAAVPAAPAAKAAPAPAPAPAPEPESYAALGQEPGWALKIGGGRIDYAGNYGEKKITVARPEPRVTRNGRRYTTPRLSVAISYTRCNDAMSGFGFEHQVTIVADGETYKGCGGARKTEWDM
jgi:uncharacterized membrane protein